ncbi:hypothetical protein PJL18_02474 [Paenarthrobacter nicotinovorans]|nr:hypothetical protein [Paenarthrobacter nicotinovorans]
MSVASAGGFRLVTMFPGPLMYVPSVSEVTSTVMVQDSMPAARSPPVTEMELPPATAVLTNGAVPAA